MGQPDPADPGATPPAPNTEPSKTEPATGDGLGDAGKRALDALRAENKELAKQLKEIAGRDPLKDLLAKLGGTPSEPGTDPAKALQDRIDAMERKAAEAETRAMRLEVAQAKGLNAAQAKRLQGTTREELERDADDLLAAFPTPPAADGKPRTPAPDRSQGARGGTTPGMLTRSDIQRLAKEGKHAEIEKARVEGRIDYTT
jgi:hypothetical protein